MSCPRREDDEAICLPMGGRESQMRLRRLFRVRHVVAYVFPGLRALDQSVLLGCELVAVIRFSSDERTSQEETQVAFQFRENF